MADRREVQPHHLLRAALVDVDVRAVLTHLGAEPDEMLLTLDGLWLAAGDTIDVEEVAALGIDMTTVLTVLNPPFDEQPDWGGRRLTAATRDLLVRALAMRSVGSGRSTSSGHVLLALMSSRDRFVAGTFAAHGLRTRDARVVVERWGRRS